MWSRVVEFMFGCWLAVSPFVFRHNDRDWTLWVTDFVAALVVMTLSAGSYWRPTQWAHLLLIPVAGYLLAEGWLGAQDKLALDWMQGLTSDPHAPGLQNHIVVGLFLLMFAIIPCEASQPPPSWRRAEPTDS